MKFNFLPMFSCLLLLSTASLMCGNAGSRPGEGSPLTDTAKKSLQSVVNNAYDVIAQYAGHVQQEQQLRVGLDSIKTALQQIDSQLVKAELYDLGKLCAELDAPKANTRIKQRLRQIHDTIFRLEQEKKRLDAEQTARQLQFADATQAVKRIQPQATQVMKQVQQLTDTLSGPVALQFNRKLYRIFIAENKTHKVEVHNSGNKALDFAGLRQLLTKKKNAQLLMLMNAGMYNPDFSARGLLIRDRKILAAADTTALPQDGNFYLYPNGVFFIDTAGQYGIADTRSYLTGYLKKGILHKYATQSGPMLVVAQQLHHRFNVSSVNYNIRNGVGIINPNKSIFIIAEEPVSFFEFALVFRYFFNCANALYLDGAISRMYLQGQKDMPAGTFGPMISITQLQK